MFGTFEPRPNQNILKNVMKLYTIYKINVNDTRMTKKNNLHPVTACNTLRKYGQRWRDYFTMYMYIIIIMK